MTSRDQRRSIRLATTLPVRWLRRGVGVDLIAKDINAHGLFLQTAEEARVGSMLQLEVRLPQGTISVFVIVRFIGQTASGPGMGVEVYLMGDDERRKWLNYYWQLIQQQKNGVADIGAR